MPYYRITIWQPNKKPMVGIRHSTIPTPEAALSFFWEQTLVKLSRQSISKFEVVMLPKTSREVREYLRELEKRQ